MQIVGDVLTSSNGVFIAILFIVLVVICIKYGNIMIKTDKVKLGKDGGELERTIMRNQKEWCKLALEAFERQMPKFEGYDILRGQLIMEKVYDEMLDWIMLNHIRTEQKYIEIKQTKVWNIVQKYTVNEEMKSDRFKQSGDEQIKSVIEMLVKIRRDYNKNGEV